MTGRIATHAEEKALDRLALVALLFALFVASLISVASGTEALSRVLSPVSGVSSDTPAILESASSLRGEFFP